MFGGFFQFNFSKRFGIQPEINFAQGSSEFSDNSADIYNDLFLGGSQKEAKFNYLKVPVLLNINVGLSKHVKIQVGPQYSNLLKATIDSLKSNQSIFKKANWSAVGGLWIQIPFVNFGARYELGLTNINNIDGKENWKTQGFTVFAGFTF